MMKLSRTVIAVDLDNVVFDNFTEEIIARYNEGYGMNLSAQGITEYDFRPLLCPECDNVFSLCDEGFFAKMRITEEAKNFIDWANLTFEVVFVTSGALHTLPWRAERLAKEFPWFKDSHLVRAVDKSLIRADYLIDDDPSQLSSFRGISICFNRAWNQKVFADFYATNLWEARDIIFAEEAVLNGKRN